MPLTLFWWLSIDLSELCVSPSSGVLNPVFWLPWFWVQFLNVCSKFGYSGLRHRLSSNWPNHSFISGYSWYEGLFMVSGSTIKGVNSLKTCQSPSSTLPVAPINLWKNGFDAIFQTGWILICQSSTQKQRSGRFEVRPFKWREGNLDLPIKWISGSPLHSGSQIIGRFSIFKITKISIFSMASFENHTIFEGHTKGRWRFSC